MKYLLLLTLAISANLALAEDSSSSTSDTSISGQIRLIRMNDKETLVAIQYLNTRIGALQRAGITTHKDIMTNLTQEEKDILTFIINDEKIENYAGWTAIASFVTSIVADSKLVKQQFLARKNIVLKGRSIVGKGSLVALIASSSIYMMTDSELSENLEPATESVVESYKKYQEDQSQVNTEPEIP